MQDMKLKMGTERSRRIIKLILALICAATLVFFLIRFVPLSHKDDEAELLRVVSKLYPMEQNYSPSLVQVEQIQVSQRCQEDLLLLLQAMQAEGFEPVLLEGYVDRKTQRLNYSAEIEQLQALGLSYDEAEALMLSPGENEHQLGLAVDIADAANPVKDPAFADSQLYKWLEEHCWEYGFVIRYPQEKEELTGREFVPWHFRYVGSESAMLMKELQLCLEEFYTWFYSDEVIIIE